MKNFGYVVIALFTLAVTPAFAKAAKQAGDESHIEYQKHRIAKAAPAAKTKNKAKEVSSPVNVPQEQVLSVCQVQFDVFQDQRPNKETVGSNFAKSLMPIGLDQWLQNAEADLWQGKVKKSDSGKNLVLKPKLDRLYAYAQSMNIHGVIALTVDFVVDGKVIETKKYRGLGSTTNAWNAEHEYYDALSYAAHDAMPKVLKDIPAVCAKAK